jgi:hypothetical protein
MTDQESRPTYVCVSRAFFANRFFNPGDCVKSKKNPGPNFRPFDPEKDRPTVRVSTVPLDDFTQN